MYLYIRANLWNLLLLIPKRKKRKKNSKYRNYISLLIDLWNYSTANSNELHS